MAAKAHRERDLEKFRLVRSFGYACWKVGFPDGAAFDCEDCYTFGLS